MNKHPARNVGAILFALGWASAASAQSSPFATGATAFQTNLLAILSPIAVIAVMGLGVGAWFNRISWSWAAGGAMGILLVFGAPQVVSWIRGLAGV